MMERKFLHKKTTFVGDAVRLTFSKVLTLCITTITTMLLARFRTLEEYGTYSQILLVTSLFSSIFMLGLPNSINYFLARAESEQEKQKFLSVYYTLSTILSVLMGVVLVLAVPLVEIYFNNPNISVFFYFLAVYPWTSVISSSVENVLVVYQKTHILMGYRVVNCICLLATVLVVQGLQMGFETYMFLSLVVYMVFAVSVYVMVARLSGGLCISLDKKLVHNILVFSVPIGLASVVGTINIEIDKLLIGYLMDTEQMAIYTNASKELPVAFIASSITAVLLPRMTKLLKKEQNCNAIQIWGYATELSFMVIALIATGCFTFAEDIMTILYSEKYLPGTSVFRVYTVVLLLRCTYFGMVLNARGETKKIFYSSIVTLIMNVVLNPLFYWLFGMVGPAIATFVSILIMQGSQLIMSANNIGMSLKEIFPWLRLGKILLINIAFAIFFSVIKNVLMLDLRVGSVVESIMLGVVWSFLYVLFMRKTIKQLWKILNSEKALE